MTWGYLGEFWDAITGVGDYTIVWFQNVGNAVAGAVGNLFQFINHSLSDIFIYAGWFFDNIGQIFTNLFSPIQYIFQFLKTFIGSAIATPVDSNIWTFSDEIKEVFSAVPYWDSIMLVLGLGVLIIVAVVTLKQFLHT